MEKKLISKTYFKQLILSRRKLQFFTNKIIQYGLLMLEKYQYVRNIIRVEAGNIRILRTWSFAREFVTRSLLSIEFVRGDEGSNCQLFRLEFTHERVIVSFKQRVRVYLGNFTVFLSTQYNFFTIFQFQSQNNYKKGKSTKNNEIIAANMKWLIFT